MEPLPFQDNSVDNLIAHHVLEHIGENFLSLMKEIYRVCKPDAILDIKFPHYRSDIQHMDPTHKRTLTVDQFLLFSKKYNLWHIEQFSSSSGFGLKLDVDFEVLKYKNNATPKWDERFKTMTEEQIQEVSENFNNVYFETHIMMQVKK
jgi:predicted SAM-dependent methyltransferase